jgi:uncharacterized protein (UPF0335 family)
MHLRTTAPLLSPRKATIGALLRLAFKPLLHCLKTHRGELDMKIVNITENLTENVTAEELRQFIERIEAQNTRISEETEDRKEIYAEAKGRGYCTKTIRKIVTLRKKRADQIAEEEAIEALYRETLGL